MRRFIYVMSALVMLTGCAKEYQSKIVLGVDNVRINLSAAYSGDFTYPVHSTGDWTMSVENGEEWLVSETVSGSGKAYPVFHATANEGEDVRVAVIVVTNGELTRKTCVVQSGSVQAYSDISDEELGLI